MAKEKNKMLHGKKSSLNGLKSWGSALLCLVVLYIQEAKEIVYFWMLIMALTHLDLLAILSFQCAKFYGIIEILFYFMRMHCPSFPTRRPFFSGLRLQGS